MTPRKCTQTPLIIPLHQKSHNLSIMDNKGSFEEFVSAICCKRYGNQISWEFIPPYKGTVEDLRKEVPPQGKDLLVLGKPIGSRKNVEGKQTYIEQVTFLVDRVQ